MFMSERTIKIAYISAAQRGHDVVCLKGAWAEQDRRGQTVAASVTNLCAIARLNGVVY